MWRAFRVNISDHRQHFGGYLDVRVVRQELFQRGPENRLGRVLVGRDSDGPRRLLQKFA